MVTAWPNNVPGNIIAEFQTCARIVTHLNGIVCNWCNGRGHDAEKCATKYRLSAEAKAAKVTWDMGALKGLCWDPDTIRTQAQRIEQLEAQVSTLGKRRRLH